MYDPSFNAYGTLVDRVRPVRLDRDTVASFAVIFNIPEDDMWRFYFELKDQGLEHYIFVTPDMDRHNIFFID